MGATGGRVYSGGGGSVAGVAVGGALAGTLPNPTLQARRTPEDANCIISWRMNEGTAAHPNSGNGGALVATQTGTAVSGGTGVIDGCVEFGDGGTGILQTPNTEIVPTPGAFTLILWTYLRAFDVAGTIFAKAYRDDGTWNAPFGSLYLVQHDALGNWDFYAAFAGALVGPVSAGLTIGKGRIPLAQWTMLAVTYDKAAAGGTVIQYTNGSESLKTTGFGGVDVDFNAGHGGPYAMGLVPGINANPMHGAVDEPRLYNGVMTPQQLGTYYRRAMNLSDA